MSISSSFSFFFLFESREKKHREISRQNYFQIVAAQKLTAATTATAAAASATLLSQEDSARNKVAKKIYLKNIYSSLEHSSGDIKSVSFFRSSSGCTLRNSKNITINGRTEIISFVHEWRRISGNLSRIKYISYKSDYFHFIFFSCCVCMWFTSLAVP